MTRKKTAMATTLFAASGTTLLLLTGCGGSDSASGDTDNGSGAVYEFQTNGIDPADEITVHIPDDLKEIMDEDKQLIINEFTVKAHNVESNKLCAAELDLDWTDGQPDAILANNSEDSARAEIEQELLDMTGADSLDEIVDDLDTVYRDNGIYGKDMNAADYSDNTAIRIRNDFADLDNDYSGLIDEVAASSKSTGAKYAGQSVVDAYFETLLEDRSHDGPSAIAEVLGTGSGASLDDFNPNDPETGTFVADDHSSAIVVSNCAKSDSDPDNAIDLQLPTEDEDDGGNELSSFAEVQISVMSDGTIGIGGEVSDYMRDANDDWIKE